MKQIGTEETLRLGLLALSEGDLRVCSWVCCSITFPPLCVHHLLEMDSRLTQKDEFCLSRDPQPFQKCLPLTPQIENKENLENGAVD